MTHDLATSAAAMLVALAIEAALGWPDALFRRFGHPVTWIGALIARLEVRLNPRGADGQGLGGRGAGALAALIVIAAAALPCAALWAALPNGVWGAVLGGVLAWPLVAARSMYDHVAGVARPLRAGDLAAARGAVALIVGRDPAQLDRAGVARAALESLAENTSDGVIAPLFWGAVFGLPGIAAYKAINTLDSMIGHKSPRYLRFGWFAARLDDGVNLIPARLSGALFAGASRRGWAVMLRDARAHRSPNAGWPEAALAGRLGVRLSGPRAYETGVTHEPWLNGGAPDPEPRDLAAGLWVYLRVVAAAAALLLALAAWGAW